MVKKVTQCCCGVSLRTGTLIIGVVYSIKSALVLTAFLVLIARAFSPAVDRALESVGEAGSFFFVYIWTLRSLYIIFALLMGIQLIANILIIVGSLKRKGGLALPWLIINIVYLVILVICYVALAVLYFLAGATEYGIATISVGVIYTGITIYFLLVVNSFYNVFYK